MSTVLPAALALASAASFSFGSALQHRAVGQSTDDADSGPRVIRQLLHRPSWLIGLALSAVAFTLHALALSQGNLVLVQPIIVSGIVFAVLIRAGLERHWPPLPIMVWLLITWGGLALFLVVRPGEEDQATRRGVALIFTGIGVAVVVVLRVVADRADGERRRGLLLGASSGLLFGLVAGLLKLSLDDLAEGGLSEVFGSWPVWTLAAIGIWAVILNQRAYQATRLSITAPTLNVVQVLIALLFGVIVLAEPIGSSVGVVIGQVIGLAVMIIGIAKLAASD